MIINKNKMIASILTVLAFSSSVAFAQSVSIKNLSGHTITELQISDKQIDNITQSINNNENLQKINLNNRGVALFKFTGATMGIPTHLNGAKAIEGIESENNSGRIICLSSKADSNTQITITNYANDKYSGHCDGPGCESCI